MQREFVLLTRDHRVLTATDTFIHIVIMDYEMS